MRKVGAHMVLLVLNAVVGVLTGLPHDALTAHIAKSALVGGRIDGGDRSVGRVELPVPLINGSS